MSGIVLSSSVRQNLLSLQSTADLLSTTQNRLATGNKVNSALDNPTNYFTAQSLDNRASDINNLLDGIGNGVQVLQAANTGITSLQKLVDSAKSVANQALQTTVGYTKSTVTSGVINGATAANLLGSAGAATDATVAGTVQNNNHLGAFQSAAVTGSAELNDNTTTAVGITGNTLLSGTPGGASDDLSTPLTATDTITVNGKTIAFNSGAGTSGSATAGTLSIDITTGKVQDILDAVNAISGGTSSLSAGGAITLNTGTTSDLTLGGTGLAALGLSSGTTARTNAAPTPAAITGNTLLSGTATTTSDAVSSAFTATDTIVVNGKTIAFNSGAGTTGSAAAGTLSIDVTTGKVQDILSAIDSITGGSGSSVTGGVATLHTGTAADLVISGTGLAKLGLSAGTTARTPGIGGLSGQTLTIGATGGGTATNIVFGTGAGQVSTLNQLNAALAANNLQASIDSTGKITLTTTNDSASADIGVIGGTAAAAGSAFNGLTINNAVADPDSQATRADLVNQYNNIIQQITTTAQDASFNGVNLLNGDQLKLTFNETGKSTLNITGVNFNPAGLGLSTLAAGTDFVDNAATNKVLTDLNTASSTLRSQASALGSNLSIVQIRQDFSKNLINVLQTGSSNLTLADTNEEAANSQALATRQSIAVSALALANQSQQSVLRLLQ